jgi:spore coat polysaccharide biosynthesis protein SpsF
VTFRAVIILQARMASQRLPGKALAPIGGRSVLAHCLERLRNGSAAPVLLATTTNAEDDVLELQATRMGVPTFRGPDADVLSRFVLAADSVGADIVVRATADNPAVDIDAPGRVLALMASTSADHVFETRLPYGAAVEAVSTSAIDPADREHVTTFVRRDRLRFRSVEIDGPVDLRRHDVRLTVDTADDLRFMRRLSAHLGDPAREPALRSIIAAADELARDLRCA